MEYYRERGHGFVQGTKVVYRHFATLYFVFIVDSTESELGILDLIQGETCRNISSLLRLVRCSLDCSSSAEMHPEVSRNLSKVRLVVRMRLDTLSNPLLV